MTINGRIFPREDVDIWTVFLKAGEHLTCEVLAERLGSPLDSRLEIRNAAGNRLCENIDFFGKDSLLHFQATEAGEYQIHIHDVNFGGLQHFVYRLSLTKEPFLTSVFPLGGRRGTEVTLQGHLASKSAMDKNSALNGTDKSIWQERVKLPSDAERFVYRPKTARCSARGILLDVSDVPEHIEQVETEQKQAVSIPAVLNGRISKPGEVDVWFFSARKGETVSCEVRAFSLGSPLDSVISLHDEEGKLLKESDDESQAELDSRLDFKVPLDGQYALRIHEKLKSRGGAEFAYRLYVTSTAEMDSQPQDKSELQLLLPADAISVERGSETNLRLTIKRPANFKEAFDVTCDPLPKGVSVSGTTVKKNQSRVDLLFKADEDATISVTPIQIVAKVTINDREQTVVAHLPVDAWEAPLETMQLAVGVKTPFRFEGVFESKFAPQGGVHFRKYKLIRENFEGPVTIQLADRQIRHLQGVSGPAVVVPANKAEFEYPVSLSPWLEVGRTSRTQLMAVGEVKDKDGTTHNVCYTSSEQADQIIVLTDPGQLSVKTIGHSFSFSHDGKVDIPVRVEKGPHLQQPVNVELITPKHIRGVMATPIKISATESKGVFTIQAQGNDSPGPFNMPLTIRATTKDQRGLPVIAEARIEMIPNDLKD